jgi:hypothetical protein
MQNDDGTWAVGCRFTGFRTRKDANEVSAWLEALIQTHVGSICEIVTVGPAGGH